MKFAHVADTHIRNLKYHKEYRVVFERLYQKLKELDVDYIIHCGDIAHTKTQISPEFVDMCSNFLKNLADIAPTYVILGNHDGNLKNSSRQDALTPIVNALKHPDLYLLKDSGEVFLDEKFTINVLSVFDTDNWQLPSDPNRVNIALYHGSISGVETDAGWRMEHGENDINIFNTFDYGFLGDIHKTNQSIDKKGKIRYPGSTVQQNHGETNDKGFLLWDILDKENFTCRHVELKNPKPFVTIKLTPKGRLPNKLELAKGCRLRLVSENSLPLGVIRKSVDAAKVRFKPESVTYLNRAAGERGSVENLASSLVQEDLRDIAVQEELIEEYLSDYQPSKQVLQDIYEINKKYNRLAEQEEDVHRNVNWKLKKVGWENLFNYGEGNLINFENLNGIVGIFGKNFSGKSSIIDSLLYILFNTTSKNNRKNLNIINQNKDYCSGYAEIDIGAKTYRVERASTKYQKKLKGKITDEAKTDVDFSVTDNATGVSKSLNGTTRIETDKNIRKIFGTIEDFLMTSMASQLDSLAFINEGSTRRKEILAKFLDLEMFDRKFRMIRDESIDLKGAIRKLSDRDFDAEKESARTKFARNETKLMVKNRECDELKEKIKNLKNELINVNSKIDSIPTEIIDIQKINQNINDLEFEMSRAKTEDEEKKKELQQEEQFLRKIEVFTNSFDIEDIKNKKQLIDSYKEKIEKIENEIAQYEKRKSFNEEKIKSLKHVPCGTSFQNKCSFIKSAFNASDDMKRVTIGLNQLTLNKKVITGKVAQLTPDKVEQYLTKYELILDKKTKQQNSINVLELELEKNKTKKLQLENKLEKLKLRRTEYEENREAIENLESLMLNKINFEDDIKNLDNSYQSCKKELLDLYRTNGSLEQRLKQIIKEKEQFDDFENQYTVADLFMRCMHSNGISYDIIKKRLPIINNEITKILTNIVDFEVFFENDEKKLDILIKHPGHDPRPIEMGSGAEKTISAMAIRLALLNVSTLPKGDIFILDEPGTALDAENMEGFVRILDMIKAHFKTVLLISHLDGLKDIVDRQIIIDNNDGYAYVGA